MKIKNIFLTGQCSLHSGRLEYGNIGNYYVIEPLIRELKDFFPNASIKTTFQLSSKFPHDVEVVPLDLYYSWNKSSLLPAVYELFVSVFYKFFRKKIMFTPYMKLVSDSDLVIDFSGDIWGDNADFLGKNRLLVGVLKSLTLQNLNQFNAMIAGSPGPFKPGFVKYLAKKSYKNFRIVTNREGVSTNLLTKDGFSIKNTYTLACPSFLFECGMKGKVQQIFINENLSSIKRPIIGFTICGWNMLKGPFNREDWKESEFKIFVEVIKNILNELQCSIVLISHSNGFIKDPEFSLTHGRDYQLLLMLQNALSNAGVTENVHLIKGIYSPYETKAIIGEFDMMVSGRVHGAVASLSQCVPTVIIDYGHEPKAHKLSGIAEMAGISEYIVSPSNLNCFTNTVLKCWKNRKIITNKLKKKIPSLQLLAKQNFALLKSMVEKEYDL